MHHIDKCDLEGTKLTISGWCYKLGQSVTAVYFESEDQRQPISGYGKESRDVAQRLDVSLTHVRFEFEIESLSGIGGLEFEFSDGTSIFEPINAKSSSTRVITLRHNLYESTYQGAFRIQGAGKVSKVFLSPDGKLTDKSIEIVDIEQDMEGEDVIVSFSCRAENSWSCEFIALYFKTESGEEIRHGNIIAKSAAESRARVLADEFVESLRQSTESIRILELGSRARSGVVRRQMFGERNTYTGADILAGENVDVVCDAHQLSQHFEANTFDSVVGFSVFEHFAMPWKVVLEINRVLKTGGRCMFFTHQTWPLHETPFDFWRFSQETWKTIFNPSTGFQIIDAACSDAAKIRPEIQLLGSVDFADAPGFLASSVLAEKVGNTELSWNVPLEEVYSGDYPV